MAITTNSSISVKPVRNIPLCRLGIPISNGIKPFRLHITFALLYRDNEFFWFAYLIYNCNTIDYGNTRYWLISLGQRMLHSKNSRLNGLLRSFKLKAGYGITPSKKSPPKRPTQSSEDSITKFRMLASMRYSTPALQIEGRCRVTPAQNRPRN